VNDFRDYTKCLERHGLKRTDHVLIAVLCEKNLCLYINGEPIRSFAFSYGKNPVSCVQNSLGTPTGLHEIVAKIGAGAPQGMIFKGRVPTGECWHAREDAGPDQRNFVTTRILRLRGLEPGHNSGPGVDSYERYIYIHGTNHPEKFPENISHGCILMKDEVLVDLFETIPDGSHVFITEN
jgi:lipoprotein-anchoring transpeptidase ErfK/SrfK